MQIQDEKMESENEKDKSECRESFKNENEISDKDEHEKTSSPNKQSCLTPPIHKTVIQYRSNNPTPIDK